VLDPIEHAKRSVELVMYEDEDPQVDAALAADERRGVRVRVLLNGGYYGQGSSENRAAYTYLTAHRVPVRWTPSYFALTHQKTLVVDGTAYILTLNFTPAYYALSRTSAWRTQTRRMSRPSSRRSAPTGPVGASPRLTVRTSSGVPAPSRRC
jgi:PLD-like domain